MNKEPLSIRRRREDINISFKSKRERERKAPKAGHFIKRRKHPLGAYRSVQFENALNS